MRLRITRPHAKRTLWPHAWSLIALSRSELSAPLKERVSVAAAAVTSMGKQCKSCITCHLLLLAIAFRYAFLTCREQQSWADLRMTSTAFYHSLTICGTMLCLCQDLGSELRRQHAALQQPATDLDSADRSCNMDGPELTLQLPASAALGTAGALAEDAEGGSGAGEGPLGAQQTLLLEVAPRVQAAGCRCGAVPTARLCLCIV